MAEPDSKRAARAGRSAPTPEQEAARVTGNANLRKWRLAQSMDGFQRFRKKYEDAGDRITHVHIKDRKMNNGPNFPFGEGDTDIRGILQMLAYS